jgi:ABC-2 type transport system permease protein
LSADTTGTTDTAEAAAELTDPAELTGPAGSTDTVGAPAAVARPATERPSEGPGAGVVRGYLRFYASELRLVFRRRRNQLLLLVVFGFPLIIGIGLKFASPQDNGGGGGGGNPNGPNIGAFLNELAFNGVFLTFTALTALLILVLPLVVAVVAGDSVAGEAGYGTLRYLLTRPAGRTRTLSVKYLAILTYGLVATFIIAITSLLLGVILFPVGPVTLLSGTTVSLAAGLVRVLWVTLYIAAAMAAIGAIGMAISTLTEHAIGAIAAIMVLVVTSEVADQVPQFSSIAPYLPTHWWYSYDSLLRTPIDTTTLWHGLLSFAVYTVVFCAVAWAKFTTSDVTS